jgi:hypothetical protein
MVFSYFWVFCISLPNQVEHTCLKFQLQICKHEWAWINFVDGGLDSKLQHCGPCINSWKKIQKLHIQIIAVTLKVTSCKTMSQKKSEKKWKTKILWAKQTIFWEPCPSPLGQFQPHGCMQELLRKYMKNELNTCFQQKFAMGSYGVGIGCAWCSRKTCEISSSLV